MKFEQLEKELTEELKKMKIREKYEILSVYIEDDRDAYTDDVKVTIRIDLLERDEIGIYRTYCNREEIKDIPDNVKCKIIEGSEG